MTSIATGSEQRKNNRYQIRVLDRAIDILSLLSDGQTRSANEISERIGLSPSTTFRLLSALAFHHYVHRDEATNEYQLGLACLELSRGFQVSNLIRKVALPFLEELRDSVKETVHLAVLDQMEIVYLEKLPGLHAIGLMISQVGGRAPAYCTGVGKALLAHLNQDVVRDYFERHAMKAHTRTTITDIHALLNQLEEVRAKGYAIDSGEHEDEVRCIAVPIFNGHGQVAAALSISGPSLRLDPLENNTEMIEKALQTGRFISQQMGHYPERP